MDRSSRVCVREHVHPNVTMPEMAFGPAPESVYGHLDQSLTTRLALTIRRLMLIQVHLSGTMSSLVS